jgi:hypothetical protein
VLVKDISQFSGIHREEKIIVCGCGQSLKEFESYHSKVITIGVNDVPLLFTPTYLLVTDHLSRFSEKRKKIINESSSKHLFTNTKGWRHPSIVHFQLGTRGVTNLDNPRLVDHYMNSPFVGVNIAYKMGSTNIAIIGVDFTDGHFYAPKDGPHNLTRSHFKTVNQGYGLLLDRLKKRGVGFYNLSQESKLTTVPKMGIEKFLEL